VTYSMFSGGQSGKPKGYTWENDIATSNDTRLPGITGFDTRWEGDPYLSELTYIGTLQANKRSRVYRCAKPDGETVVVKVYPRVSPKGQANYHHPEKAHLSTHLENEIWALEILSSWPYAPQLLYKNMAALTVVMEDVGDTVETNTRAPSTDIPLAKRKEILAWTGARVRELAQMPRSLYHNDIYLRNICYNQRTQQMYLVDYGHLDYKEARGEPRDAELNQLKGDLGLGGHFAQRIT